MKNSAVPAHPALFDVQTSKSPTWISWSPDGEWIAHGGAASPDVAVLNGHTGEPHLKFACDAQTIHGSWSSDAERIAVTEVGQTTVRKLKTGAIEYKKASPNVQFAVWHPTRHQIAVDAGDDMAVIDPGQGKVAWSHSFRRRVYDVRWRSDGAAIVAYDGGVRALLDGGKVLWDRWTGSECTTIAVAPSGIVAIAAHNLVVVVADKRELRLQHHTESLRALSFSPDSRLLASRAADGSIAVWNTETWQIIAAWRVSRLNSFYSMEFSPASSILACSSDHSIVFYDFETAIASGKVPTGRPSVQYTTAKIALVGDSGVGKTGLGWRLAYGFFKDHPSTHGEQFWLADRLSTVRADKTRCEAVIWDLAGQPDYRLIHSLFVDDADIALVVFDPTNREDPLKGAEYWLQTLSRSKRKRCRSILVPSRIDRGSGVLTEGELDALAAKYQVDGGVIATSAARGDGIDQLLRCIAKLINWEERPATVTLETFKQIKDQVLEIKENDASTDILITMSQLQQMLQQKVKTRYDVDDIVTATKHLADHGYVRHLRSSTGTRFVLLSPDLLNNLAASMVVEARANAKGLGALDERRVLASEYSFPELQKLDIRDREVLLDAATTLFIEHNVCFRETLGSDTFLIFPSLINQNKPPLDDLPPMDEGTAYTACGATENVYASLVVLLGYTNTFTRTNQWRNQAQYEMGDGQVCGFRLTEEREGQIDLVLYFGKKTAFSTKQLFQGLFEKFLLARDVDVQIFPPIPCPKCKYVQPRSEIIRRQREQLPAMFCSNCGRRIPLPQLMLTSGMLVTPNEALDHEQGIAASRTQFEKAITWLKSYLRDTRPETKAPSCFVSYASGDPAHDRWIERSLATDLRNAGIEVILDQWHSKPGVSISRFIEQIERVGFVAVVGTTRLREKYDSSDADPVIAPELKLVNDRLMLRESESERIIPLLLEGDPKTTFPPLLKTKVFIDFRNEDAYFERMFDLLLTLYRIPFDDPAMRDLRDTVRAAGRGGK